MILTTLRSIGQGFYKMSLNWDLYIRPKVMGLGRRQSAIFISSYQGYLPSGWYHFFFFFFRFTVFFRLHLFIYWPHSQHVGSSFPSRDPTCASCRVLTTDFREVPRLFIIAGMGNLNHQNEVALVDFTVKSHFSSFFPYSTLRRKLLAQPILQELKNYVQLLWGQNIYRNYWNPSVEEELIYLIIYIYYIMMDSWIFNILG